jgi:tetratricopeptide (TPR) repeat protein
MIRRLLGGILALAVALMAGLAVAADPAVSRAVEARQTWNVALVSEVPLEKLEAMRAARTLLKRIPEEFPESELATRVAGNQVVAGLTLTRMSRDIDTLEKDLGPCFSAPTRACLIDAAIAGAEGLPDPGSRAIALANVASVLARAGDADRATRLRDRAVELATTTAPDVMPDVLEAVAWTNAHLGDDEQALRTAEIIEQPLLRAWAYLEIVAAQGDDGRTADALQTVERLKRFAEQHDDPQTRAEVTALLAAAYAEVGEDERAFMTAFDAVELASAVKDWSASDVTYTLASAALAWAGESEWAWRTVSEEIADPSYRCVAHAFIAATSSQAGNLQEARLAIALSDQVCPEPQDAEGVIEFALPFMAMAQARVGDLAAAIETARTLGGSGFGRAWALGEVALAMP